MFALPNFEKLIHVLYVAVVRACGVTCCYSSMKARTVVEVCVGDCHTLVPRWDLVLELCLLGEHL
jgi:hypothetical protein